MNTRDSDDDKPDPDKIVDRRTAQQELLKTQIAVELGYRRRNAAEWADIIRDLKYRVRREHDA